MVRALGLVFPMILACSGAPPSPDPGVPTVGLPAPSGVEEPAASATAEPAPPRHARSATADPRLSAGPGTLDRRVDLELAHAPIADAFRFLADAADVNVVLADGVSGEVTLRLRRVTVRDALRAVAATRGLRTEWRGNILWVGDGVR